MSDVLLGTPLKYSIRHVTEITDDELAKASWLLGNEFQDNTFTEIVTNWDYDFFIEFWSTVVIAGSLAGEIYFAETPDKKIIGVSVWFGPGRVMYDSEDQREKALSIVLNHFSPELKAWWMEDFLPKYEVYCDNVLGTDTKKNNWHLQSIATHPDFRRRGVATALIDVVKTKASEKGELLVLETQSTVNVEIYCKLGWKTMSDPTTFKGLKGQFTMWIMEYDTKEDSYKARQLD